MIKTDSSQQAMLTQNPGRRPRPGIFRRTWSRHCALLAGCLLLAAPSMRAFARPAMLAAGLAHSLYVDKRGRLWAWGNGQLGQLGPGTAAASASPLRPAQHRLVNMAVAGWNHNLALTRTGQLLAWGFDDVGQLGVGLMAPYTATRGWVMDQPAALPDPGHLVALAAGVAHSLAVTSNGELWVWGWNGDGQLGLSNQINYWSPVMSPYINGVKKVAAGGSHSLALLGTGVIMSWGLNDQGQLGDGTMDSHSVPQLIRNLGVADVTALAAGMDFSLALDSTGQLFAWGANDSGQLGLGDTQQRLEPEQVKGLPPLQAISAGGFHALALARDGTLYAWGANACGELGDGTTAWRATPRPVPGLPPIVTMAAGFHHNLALDHEQQIWVWGSNDHLQLGLATPEPCLAIPQPLQAPS